MPRSRKVIAEVSCLSEHAEQVLADLKLAISKISVMNYCVWSVTIEEPHDEEDGWICFRLDSETDANSYFPPPPPNKDN